jgi:hypothetical protein
MRCNIRSCAHKSDWCWEDPKDNKHYKLRTPHLEPLIDYVDEGDILDGHDDIPGDIRQDLILESQTGRKSKKKLMRQQRGYHNCQCFSSTKRWCAHDYFISTQALIWGAANDCRAS